MDPSSSFPKPLSGCTFSLFVSKQRPRTLALVPSKFYDSVLTLQLLSTTDKFMVKTNFEKKSDFILTHYEKLVANDIHGVLGLLNWENDILLSLVTSATQVAVIEQSRIYRVSQVQFYSLLNNKYDIPNASYLLSESNDNVSGTYNEVDALFPFIRFFTSGSFYFTPDKLDLSRSTQARYTNNHTEPDFDYIWNHHMAKPFLHLTENLDKKDLLPFPFLLYVIQGHVQSYKEGSFTVSLLSRINCRRAGTRYHIRGIDDQGAVANFVETETILCSPPWLYSFLQIRGSVPVFWDQPGIQVMGHKVQLTRSRKATQPAFLRHFEQLAAVYGAVTAINLVSIDTSSSETLLGTEYKALFQALPASSHALVEFDFHAMTKGNQYHQLLRLLDIVFVASQKMDTFAYHTEQKKISRLQQGVFRTNCVDCLDRTNVIQALLSEQVLKAWLSTQPFSLDNFKDLWADNGDALSRCYAGTGALKSGFTRSGRRTLAGLIDDSLKSVNRFVINNFQDRSRQEVIDTILGKLSHREIVVVDAFLEAVANEVRTRELEFTTTSTIAVHVGTFNVNGKLPEGSLTAFVKHADSTYVPDVLVFGLQEIVELTPGQIVAADPIKRHHWQQALVHSISQAYKSTSYCLICDGQLVGAAIFVFAKSDLLPHLHELESVTVKTGLAGMAGNKGAIAVRFKLHATSFCFLTAHLAAGQNNVADRIHDFEVIVNETKFRHGKILDDHDHVIWLGDFNFRIDLEYDKVFEAIDQQAWTSLAKFDQLLMVRSQGKAFSGYEEKKLTFPPTYKFDVGTSSYDTSAKQRVPAWCDRVVYKSRTPSHLMTCSTYDMISDWTLSDHRPVYAVLHAPVVMIHEAKKEAIKLNAKRSLQRSLSQPDLISFHSPSPALPLPSSEIPASSPPLLPPRPGTSTARGNSLPLGSHAPVQPAPLQYGSLSPSKPSQVPSLLD